MWEVVRFWYHYRWATIIRETAFHWAGSVSVENRKSSIPQYSLLFPLWVFVGLVLERDKIQWLFFAEIPICSWLYILLACLANTHLEKTRECHLPWNKGGAILQLFFSHADQNHHLYIGYKHGAFQSTSATKTPSFCVMRGVQDSSLVLPLTFHYIKDQNKYDLHVSKTENFFHILFHFKWNFSELLLCVDLTWLLLTLSLNHKIDTFILRLFFSFLLSSLSFCILVNIIEQLYLITNFRSTKI